MEAALVLEVERGGMEARLSFDASGVHPEARRVFGGGDLRGLFNRVGVTEGIEAMVVEECLERIRRGESFERACVAVGQAPTHGRDSWFRFSDAVGRHVGNLTERRAARPGPSPRVVMAVEEGGVRGRGEDGGVGGAEAGRSCWVGLGWWRG
ncbi:MAG: hypothetical protein HYY13_02290 [Nitrospirae bacterium]|nr:hypothetical protein [Nitrospirota bacterium]